MRITVEKKKFEKALKNALKAVPARTTLPILECFKLEAKGKRLQITGSSFDFAVKASIDVIEVFEEGAIAVPAKLFTNIVARLDDACAIVLLGTEKVLKIISGGAHFEIALSDVSDFPVPAAIAGTHSVLEIESNAFKEVSDKVLYAAARDMPGREVLEGVQIKVTSDKKLRCAACDGYRIAVASTEEPINAKSEGTSEVSFIVKGTSLKTICSILPDEVPVECFVDNEHIALTAGDIKISTALIVGEYIDIDRLFKCDTPGKIVVNATPFVEALARCKVLTSTKGDKSLVALNVDKEKGLLRVFCKAAVGDMEDIISLSELTWDPYSSTSTVGDMKDIVSRSGAGGFGDDEEFRIGFNSQYLADAVSSLGCENVALYFAGPTSPVIVTDDDEPNRGKAMVLPVRLHG